MSSINYFCEGLNFKLPNPRKTSRWIKGVIASEGYTLTNLNFIFCSDNVLLDINQRYLKHSTLTDIITFDYSEEKNVIAGEIYISVNRVEENAEKFRVVFENELHRVIIHGVLHLVGYSDKKKDQREIMRQKENSCLDLIHVPRET